MYWSLAPSQTRLHVPAIEALFAETSAEDCPRATPDGVKMKAIVQISARQIESHETYDLILIDAFRGGYVPFHLLTKEFYTLLKQHLSPKGVVVFNVHSGTKLADSTLFTLKSVFPTIDLYSNGGSFIPVASTEPAVDPETLMQRAKSLQAKYNFLYPMPSLLSARVAWPDKLKAELLTDDFAPVSVYDVIKKNNVKQW
jgi:spermidine synthase